jgi:Predicted membrane protein (DUF2306)/Tetratricopeptide repeat
MSVTTWTHRLEFNSVADSALKFATRAWFAAMVVGQLVFAFAVASFYGRAAVSGDLDAWNKFMTHGYIAGATTGNAIVGVHVFSAVVLMISGLTQLVPQIRARYPVVHRWNGRLYLLTASTLSFAGVYMHWIRGSVGDFSQHLGSTLNAVLIVAFAVMALRTALARNFRSHRRWALRLFLVASASWFFRVTFFLSFVVFRGPFGFDPITFTGPFLTFGIYAQYLFPWLVLEIYFWVQDRAKASERLAMAGGLFGLTLAMVAGIFAVTMGAWVPQVKAAYDAQISIADTMAKTIATSGVEPAIAQYRTIQSSPDAAHYHLEESELNNLGYRIIRIRRYSDAIRIFQFAVEMYPQSANAYDSLGEAYMDAGDKAQALANYRKSLELNPANRNAVQVLAKLDPH